ncbi:MAG TPA: hypothetical protein VF276_05955 [Chloroflexia bacterium]
MQETTRPIAPNTALYSRQNTTIRASLIGLGAMVLLALAILFGSRMLTFFDPALTGYAIASLFAAFGVAFHYGTWLMRPSTRTMWRRSWQFFLKPENARRYFWVIPRAFISNLLFQRFISKRSTLRWIMHQCLFWGVILSFAVTFPLTFGWVHFEVVGGSTYRVYLLGFPTITMDSLGPVGFNTFHALDYFAVLVIIGVAIAYWRRWQDRAVKPQQRVLFDLLPLHLLMAISITGIMLTIVDFFFAGWMHWPITLTHQFLVIMMILYLPFGKLFHIIERPASLGVEVYYAVGTEQGMRNCARCGRPFGMQIQVNDVKQALNGVGYNFWLPQEQHHWQDYCARCKRVIRAEAYTGLSRRGWVNPGHLQQPQYSLPTSPVPEVTGNTGQDVPAIPSA